MSQEDITYVWKHAPVRGNRLLVLLAIADQSGRENHILDEEEVARNTRLNLHMVWQYIDEMCAAGILEVDRDGDIRISRSSHG